MKIVINNCYGGFSLSPEAVIEYARLKGLTLYPEKECSGFTIWWTVPKDQRLSPLEGAAWRLASLEERAAYNQAYAQQSLSSREISRDDPFLAQVVEELKETANGRFAQLKVVEIPDDVEWEIEEYDGIEWVAEKHRTWS